MSNQIKSITNPRLTLGIISPEEIKKIHEATLSVIEKVGVRFPSKRALTIWEEHGANVDRDKMIVRVKPDVIETAMRSCPQIYSLAARDPGLDLPLDGNHVFLGTDGCGVEVMDIETGQRRTSKLEDVKEISIVADALDEIGFHWVPVSAQDISPKTRGLFEIKTIWENSTKHVQTESIYSEEEARVAIQMAEMIVGGKKQLCERPILSLMECSASPLGHDGGSLDAALVAAEYGIPTGFMTMAANLTTGPATMAGNLVVGNAEVISGLALIQLAFPGAPVFYAAAQTASDLKTGAYTGGGPEDFLYGAATNKISDFYHVPLSMGSFATGAKAPNWQAGIENSLSTFMASIVMSDMLLGAGLLHGSRIWSYEELILDCEIFSIIKKVLEGIIVNEDTLALDVIQAVGPGGNFLTQKHTLKHMRDVYLSRYMDRRPFTEWEEKKDNAHDWALKDARRILTTHHPEPLDEKISREMSGLISSLEK